jgi:AraC family transcriptional regulator of adaptative response/methylated-DNA-[protein]-cysteine methyltransferase
LGELADAAGISPFHFHRVFKQITGATPRDYARTHRLRRFAEGLEAGQPVTEAIYAAGFGSSSRVYDSGAALGMTPGARRRGGNGETIRFATVETPLGWALVAATERGICMTALADDRDGLVAALRQRFPAANIIAEDDGLKNWADRIVGFIASPERTLDLPLDIQGTAFQAQVWRALQKIPQRSANQRRCAPSPKPARRTSSPCSCRAIE